MDIKTLRFGVELETVGIVREKAARAVHSVIGGEVVYEGGGYDKWTVVAPDGRKWTAMRDGSLSSEFYGAEVVSPILTWADFDALQEVTRALRAAGARIDKSCGMHVHVDGAAFLADGGAAKVGNLVKVVAKYEDVIHTSLGIADRVRGEYCKPVDGTFLRQVVRGVRTQTQLENAWYGEYENIRIARTAHYHQSRYRGLNLHSLFFRGTVEFRWFAGSLHAGKVKANVQLCLVLVAKALEAKCTNAKVRPAALETIRLELNSMFSNLGIKGEDFKTLRHHMLADLAACNSVHEGRAYLAAQRAAVAA